MLKSFTLRDLENVLRKNLNEASERASSLRTMRKSPIIVYASPDSSADRPSLTKHRMRYFCCDRLYGIHLPYDHNTCHRVDKVSDRGRQ